MCRIVRDRATRRRAIVALMAVGLALVGVSTTRAEVEMNRLTIWTSRDSQQGGLPLIAVRKGFFKAEGLDVDVRFVSSGSEIPAGMAGGTILIGVASWVNPMQMNANGLPAVVLAQATDQSDTQQLVVRADGPIKTLKDLEGRKLGMTKIGVMLSYLNKICAAYGCDATKITLVNMLPEDIVLAYKKRDVDAILTWEPWVTYAVRDGGKELLSAEQSFLPGKVGRNRIDGHYAAVFALKGFVEKNPRTVTAVLKALRMAAQWTNANKAEASAVITKEMNIPADIVAKIMTEVTYTVTMSDEWSAEFDRLSQFLQKMGELKASVSARNVMMSQYLRDACNSCVTVK